jgi:uncharacterized membrane protein (DUF4010 family)
MLDVSSLAFRLMSALAIGLLIGAERERRKGEGPSRSPAGIRTFAIASLLGAVSVAIGADWLLAATTVAVAALTTVAYLRTSQEDPGLTTEAALVLTVLLGGLTVHHPGLSAGVSVAVAVLLAARDRIHRFVSLVLTEDELSDALIFAAGVFVVLPLVPNRYLGPFKAINPHIIWVIVILMMSISAAGYIAVRLIGPRFGLPLAGLASGFVSSAATISAMGARALKEPVLSRSAVAGAVLSTIATVVELSIVLGATNRATLSLLRTPLIASGTVAVAYGVLFTMRTIRSGIPESSHRGRPFSLKTALVFAVTIGTMLFISAVINSWFGSRGVIAAAAVAGFADAHSVAVSVASLVASGKLGVEDSAMPILAGLTTNTVTKMVLAITSGGRRFASQVIPGLMLVILGAWLGVLFSR